MERSSEVLSALAVGVDKIVRARGTVTLSVSALLAMEVGVRYPLTKELRRELSDGEREVYAAGFVVVTVTEFSIPEAW